MKKRHNLPVPLEVATFIEEEERRQICYNQVIYDDDCLELTETAGLTLVPDLDRVSTVEQFLVTASSSS